ncbi:MAG: tetratricopeptide repeat protein [Deltaproteobacteria bacterium]|nr:tetratricopeptide repeat protein [Deltaproteobacteria bacterium]
MATTHDSATSGTNLARGTGVGRYVVLAELGRGGMGTVYSAFDPDLDRKVALKLLPMSDGRSARDLGREARILAKFTHPNVASVFDVGRTETALFITMELVDGGDLTSWLGATHRSAAEILSVFVDAGRGLAAAHAKGLIHRDFKPSNVLIGSDGRVRVADFGLAQLVSGQPGPLVPGDTMRGLAMSSGTSGGGTPGFIAPEILDGDPPSPGADQYAYCVSLVWGLTGSMPDEHDDVEAALSSKRVPRGPRRAIVRGLSPRPTDRFESMEGLLAGLAVAPVIRRRLAVGAVLGLVGGVAVTWSLARANAPSAPPIDRCAAGRDALASIWNEARAEPLTTALTGRDAVYATQTATRVVTELDAYAEVWTQAHAGLCANPRGNPSADGPLQCLDDRLLELEAMRAALSQPDGSALDHATRAVAGLRSPSFCTDPAWQPPPANLEPAPSAAAAVAALRPPLELGVAYIDTGQFDRALTQLQEVDREAEATHHLPLIAEARYHLGMVMMQQGHYDQAKPTLHDAFATALTCGHDEVMVQAASLLVYANKDRHEDLDHAQLWSELARAAVDRLGPKTEQAATYWQAVGIIALQRGEYAPARDAFERALALNRDHLPPDHPAIVVPLSLLASLDAEQRRYVDAERRAREALALRSAILGDQHPDLISDLVTLASALTPQDKPDEAIEHLERALSLGLSTLDPEHPRRLGAANNLASALNRKGDHQRAAALYTDVLLARQQHQGPDDPATGLAHHNLATALFHLGTLEEAIEHHHRSLEIFEAAFGPRHSRVVLGLNGLATVLESAHRCDEGLSTIERAWAIVREPAEGEASPHPLAPFVANNRAVLLLCNGDASAALDSARHAVDAARTAPGEPLTALPKLLVTQARAQFQLGDYPAALRSAEQATETLGPRPSLSWVRADFILAQLARRRGASDEATTLARRALTHLPEGNPRGVALGAEITAWIDG